MPFHDFLPILKPIMDLYDECEYEDASIMAKKELANAKDRNLSVVLQVLMLHLEGYSRWESSYDYAMARELLRKADGVIDASVDSCPKLEQKGLLSLKTLNGVVTYAIDLENALISTDPKSMTDVAGKLESLAAKGLEYLSGLEEKEGDFVDWLRSTLMVWKYYGAGVAAYGAAMSALRTPRFRKVYAESEKTILASLEYLEGSGDEDSFTELSSYYAFLQRHAEIAEKSPEYLVLRSNELNWLLSFWVEERHLNDILDKLLEDSSGFVNQMNSAGIHVETVDEDSISDLFETVLGADRMKNLVISMKPVTLSFRGKDVPMTLSVRLYRYAIGTIYLKAEEDEMTVSDLRTYLTFNGPQSAEYLIKWQDRTYRYISELASEIVEALQKSFAMIEPGSAIRFVPHLNWYAYALIRHGISTTTDGERTVVTLEQAAQHPDFRGLLIGQTEARAALDDWIARDPLRSRNLAAIRSHTTDLLVTTENHGVLSFPDDPHWIVVQYQETIETVVRLRCLISTLIEIAGDLLDSFVEETADLAGELDTLELDVAERRISETRRRLLPVIHFDTMAHMTIELIRGTLTSHFRDHAELLRAVMDALNVNPMVEFLERRLGILSHHETLFSDIAEGVVERRAKEQEKIEAEQEARSARAMELVGVFISILAIGDVLSMFVGALRDEPFQLTILPIYELIAYVIVIILVFYVVLGLRKGKFQRKKQASKTSVEPEAEV
jgi:hypothetical protein